VKICYIGDARSIHLRRWVDHFAGVGNEISIISYHPAAYANAQVYVIRHEENPILVPVKYPGETILIASRIRNIQPDLVHIHYVSIDGLAPALMKNIPLIASVWGSDVFHDFRVNRKFRMIIRKILKRADAVTATSRFLADETQKYLPRGKRINVIPFGVDTDFFRPIKPVKKDRNITLCYIKGLETHYGPHLLISILPKILKNYPKTRLIMVGSGSQERNLRHLSQKLNISSHVTFTGSLTPESVRGVLAKADIFIMPSLCQEAFGVAALEAQAMGVPVIGSRRGGIPEAVKDGETGILYNPDEPGELFSSICRLLDSQKLRRRMGKSGREYVTGKFGWEGCTGKMDRLYTNLIDEMKKENR